MPDPLGKKFKALLLATAIVVVTAFGIGLVKLNRPKPSSKRSKSAKHFNRTEKLSQEASKADASAFNLNDGSERAVEKDSESLTHDPVLFTESPLVPPSFPVAESSFSPSADESDSKITSDNIALVKTFLNAGDTALPPNIIHSDDSSESLKDITKLDHPSDSEFSNNFYLDSNEETCLVYNLLIPQTVPFDTMLLQVFPHHHHFEDPSPSSKEQLSEKNSTETVTKKAEKKKRNNRNDKKSAEPKPSKNHQDFSVQKDLKSLDNVSENIIEINLLKDAVQAPSLPPTLPSQDADAKILDLNLSEPDLEANSTPSFSIEEALKEEPVENIKEQAVIPAAEPKPALNIFANEFIPSSYSNPQQYHFSPENGYYDYQTPDLTFYQQNGINWMYQGMIASDSTANILQDYDVNGEYSSDSNFYGNSYVFDLSNESNPQPQTLKKKHKKQPKRNLKSKSPSFKHEMTKLGDFIDFNLDRSSITNSGTFQRQRQKSASLCIYGLTCANKECIYVHQ